MDACRGPVDWDPEDPTGSWDRDSNLSCGDQTSGPPRPGMGPSLSEMAVRLED